MLGSENGSFEMRLHHTLKEKLYRYSSESETRTHRMIWKGEKKNGATHYKILFRLSYQIGTECTTLSDLTGKRKKKTETVVLQLAVTLSY